MGRNARCVAGLVGLCLLASSGIWFSHAGMIRRSGTRFIDEGCREFMFSGWNSWTLLESATGMGSSLDEIYDTMETAGLTVGRFFGHGSSQGFVLQGSPGSYSDKALAALDKILDEASKRSIRLIVAFTDNWQIIDGKAGFAGWAGKKPSSFFTDATVKQLFKDHIRFITNRVNSLNGKKYKEDDTILAWNLINEPRCDCDIFNPVESQCAPNCADQVQAWIEEMSEFVKSEDPYHMITVGEEGFYSFNSGREHVNPDAIPWATQAGINMFVSVTGLTADDAKWAKRSGQDFVRNHEPEAIDFAAIHLWVDNWGVPTLEFQRNWIAEHINDTIGLGKPLVVEEFGKIATDSPLGRVAERDPFFQDIYDTFAQQRAAGGPLKGIGLWEFAIDKRTNISVSTEDSTWTDIIVPESQDLVAELKSKDKVQNCVPGEVRSFDAVTSDNDNQYITAGARLGAANPGSILSLESSVTLKDCLDICDELDECNAISHGNQQRGCILYSEGGDQDSLKWSGGGWQTYWKTISTPTKISVVG
ncbi:hypothetical protein BSKO_08513 [Bryopsis sp. KO-2023]|nr:hypothetical protein BSKO_08513 [Bryopsis sp. KO-2023]